MDGWYSFFSLLILFNIYFYNSSPCKRLLIRFNSTHTHTSTLMLSMVAQEEMQSSGMGQIKSNFAYNSLFSIQSANISDIVTAESVFFSSSLSLLNLIDRMNKMFVWIVKRSQEKVVSLFDPNIATFSYSSEHAFNSVNNFRLARWIFYWFLLHCLHHMCVLYIYVSLDLERCWFCCWCCFRFIVGDSRNNSDYFLLSIHISRFIFR